MKQSIAIFLKSSSEIERVRKKYLPNYNKFKLHITLVYAFEVKDQNKLAVHIKKSIKELKPFPLSLHGLKKSAKEYYLYLLVDKGKMNILKLYKTLNSGILKSFQNKKIPKYVPHITLGVFKTKNAIDSAFKELSKENLYFETKVSSIQLLTLDKTALKSMANFRL
ncbi:2'-5' RNA ligase family protein [Candidatus Woesearchaeota archaeon]|nr:MAG: 2'-5' RNA ligase family protein [Candidatus Woesearchaeota archaeon]